MQWTAELDRTLSEFHGKRLGNIFIAKWLRLNPAVVRARLIELGLSKPSPSQAKVALAAKEPDGAARDAFDEDDDADMVVLSGCPKGHLLPERHINAIYKSLGLSY